MPSPDLTRILLFGNQGQVGWELERTLAPLGPVISVGRNECDLLDTSTVRETIRATNASVIINAAAYTAVDQAEEDEQNARTINAYAPTAMAEEAMQQSALFIHYSTDYVFNGIGNRPWNERDRPEPVNVYGRTKLEGEQGIQSVGGNYIILRTSWVYSLRRPSFVSKVLTWAQASDRLEIANDQFGTPTWSRLIAEGTALLLARLQGQAKHPSDAMAGRLFHLAAAGVASRQDWAEAILSLTNESPEETNRTASIVGVSSRQFATAAKRPMFSALDSGELARQVGISLPDWKDGLRMAMAPGE
ncbi:MAG: dTDP-4-dehydrorhamnose reductase [Anaerolineales bacterium]